MIKIFKEKYKASEFAKKKQAHQLVLIICWVVVVWFLFGFTLSQVNKIIRVINKKEKIERTPTVQIKTANVKSVISQITIYGQTNASMNVPIKARTSGYVDRIVKQKGSKVQKHDVVIELSKDDRNEKLNAAKASFKSAKIDYDATLQLYKQQLASKTQLNQSKANFDMASASLKAAQLEIRYSNIEAPFKGLLDKVNVEKGDYVKRESVIGTIVDLDPIKITAEIPEKYINKVNKGVIAKIKLFSGYETDALLTYASSVANSQARTFTIELEAKNKKLKIAQGLTAEIFLPLSTVKSHKLPVTSAITYDDRGIIGLKVVDDTNTVKFYAVDIVKEEKDGIWLSGLPDIARIIINGQEYVKIGQKVDTVEKDKDGKEIKTFADDVNKNKSEK